jgi:hypothetical protein
VIAVPDHPVQAGIPSFADIHEEAMRSYALGITIREQGACHSRTHTPGYNFFKVPPEDGPRTHAGCDYSHVGKHCWRLFAVASVQMYIGESWERPRKCGTIWQNALRQKTACYLSRPADILAVPNNVLIVSYVAIGLVALVILFFLLVDRSRTGIIKC